MAGERTLPGIGLKGFFTPGTSGWDGAVAMDGNLRLASALIQLSALSRVTALPGSPTDGQIYIVPSGAGSNPNAIAIRDNGAWVYVTPATGWRAWVVDEAAEYVWLGSAWARASAPVDLATAVMGTPSASEVLLRYVFTRAVTFPDEFAGSQASAGTAAAASTVFLVKKNGSTVGTVTFAISGTTGVFATTGTTVVMAAGDVLELQAPSSPDATLANIGFTFVGVR